MSLARVGRGMRVKFTSYRDIQGRTVVLPSGSRTGMVLDRGPDAGSWWVSAEGYAVLVFSRDMDSAASR